MNIKSVITDLSKVRPIFHSEDDFKFALALQIKQAYSDFEIRLERPVYTQMINRMGVPEEKEKRTPIDIVCETSSNQIIPIELKYKTIKQEHIQESGEEYNLTQQGATDTGRFGLRKDIYRIEKSLASNPKANVGYVVMITNDLKYKKDVSKTNCIDCNYSTHHGASIQKEDHGWNPEKAIQKGYDLDPTTQVLSIGKKLHWTSKGEYAYKLNLKRDYTIDWQEYSDVQGITFWYCIIEVLK